MVGESRGAAFLDRDGVINVDRGFVWRADDFILVDGAGEAISLLNRSGYLVFVVTNQSGIGHGFYSANDFKALTSHMRSLLAQYDAHIDDVRYCPYHPEARLTRYRLAHPWRKPAPGMILDLIDHWGVDVDSSFLIGDSERDVVAARAAGVVGYLFEEGNLNQFLRRVRPELNGPR